MKIYDIQNQTGYIGKIEKRLDESGKLSSKEIESSSIKDNVALSSQSKEMQKIYDTLKETPDIRKEKVNALKQAIQKGEYNIDSQKLAEKMLKESILDIIL
ncbi:MAG: flagellar biosynthesis anti-sigma factor FlgM [Bacteroidales bacterium]